MHPTVRRFALFGATMCLGFAAFLVVCIVIAEYEDRSYPSTLPLAAVALAIVGLRYLLWARERWK
jgi:hypothetical protein